MAYPQVQVFVVSGGTSGDWIELAADSFARIKRLTGWDVNFHASPTEFSQVFKSSAENVAAENIPSEEVIAELVSGLQKTGAVYKKNTRCPVCQNCRRPAPGLNSCPACGGPVLLMERDAYFLRISRFGQDMIELLSDTGLLLPTLQLGTLANLVSKKTAEDVQMAIGIKKEKKTFFPTSWLETLAVSLAKCGYPQEKGFAKKWEETYFFCTRDKIEYIFYWCGLLLAMGLPLPGGFACHSQLLILDRKGQEVSPILLAKIYGQEALRYFMLTVKIGPGENTFSEDQVIQRINHDLANELGNLVSRVISLVVRFADGIIPVPDILTRQTGDLELRESALDTPRKVENFILTQDFSQAVKTIKNLIGKTNRFIEVTMPWQLASSRDQQARLNTVLYNICEALRFLAVALKPILPEASQSILYQLGINDNKSLISWHSLGQWGLIPVETKVIEQPVLFPRIVPGYRGMGPEPDLISREELARIGAVSARVISAEPVPDYEGFLQLILYDGRQRCKVLAPIAHSCQPSALTGKKVIMISNLRPLEVEGLYSEGEVLVIETVTGNSLVFIDDEIPEGSKVLWLN